MTVLSNVEQAPADPILGLTEQFKADQRPHKVNLGVGVYLDENGKVPLLKCVATAEQRLASDPQAWAYLPIDGLGVYDSGVKELIFGSDSPILADGRIVTVQALGGTGALKLGADLLHQFAPDAEVLISDPSWENHLALFSRAGFDVGTYRYYDREHHRVDFDGMCADLSAAAPGTIVVLHACCHNPTGCDLRAEQWERVIDIVLAGELVPFLDMAYQGLSGNIETDGRAVRRFAERVPALFCSTSFSKSFSLYGERAGALMVVCADANEAKRVLSQLKIVVRTNYSNPPTHGAQLVATVLGDEQLRKQWLDELGGMRERIKALRVSLVARLESHGVTDMGFIADQAGMFSYSGLDADQMRRLREEFAVYGTDAGRICVAALTQANVDHVAASIAAVRA